MSHLDIPFDLVPGPALTLARLVAVGDEGYVQEVYPLFNRLSGEALATVTSETAEFDANQWETLGLFLSDYTFRRPEDDIDIPFDEFVIRAAVQLLPVVRHLHLPMLNTTTTDWSGNTHTADEYDLQESVVSTIISQISNMHPSRSRLAAVRGVFLLDEYSGTEGRKWEDVLWVSEHAMELIPFSDKVFSNGFDRRLAEELIRIETPVLREGVL